MPEGITEGLRRIGQRFLQHQEKPPVKNIPDSELPTTTEIAKEGTRQFKEILPYLPPEVKKIFQDNEIKRCFASISPEVGAVDGLSLDNLEELGLLDKTIELLVKHAPDIVIIRHKKNHPAISPTLSLVNLRAAEHVIKNNPSVFPSEALANPTQWIVDNSSDWYQIQPVSDPIGDIFTIRYGLLSGFPLDASTKFQPYWRAWDKLKADIFSQKDHDFIYRYGQTEGFLNPKSQKEMTTLLGKSRADLTPDEKELIINHRRVRAEPAVTGYLGFQGEYDTRYATRLNRIFQECGILNI